MSEKQGIVAVQPQGFRSEPTSSEEDHVFLRVLSGLSSANSAVKSFEPLRTQRKSAEDTEKSMLNRENIYPDPRIAGSPAQTHATLSSPTALSH
jgi:hypothetical protein